ncbi:MAG TPA: hypothetical protein VML58_14955 [Burkholderiaceae bacterium]|nr:hypothetical protein [Burkholderiaceae bacterium]
MQQQAGLAEGMASVGIDMQRMQSDPAYAKEVQARMRAMPPDQIMAMSKAMSQPMNQNPNRHNEAQAMADEAAPIKAGAEAGFEYSTQQVGRIVGYDEGMLGEIELLVTTTEEIARSASRTVHCRSQAVTVPQAVCQ